MSKKYLAALLLIPLLISSYAIAQCCDVPTNYVMSNETIVVSQEEVWMTDVFVNGTLVVDAELTIADIDVVVGGAGIRITENGTLTVRGSRIAPHPNNTGFYLENRGRLEIYGSVLERCSDPDNSLIGIYHSGKELTMNGSSMVSSGLVHCQGGNARITGGNLSGIVSSGSDCLVEGATITSMGLTRYGDGRLEVRSTHVTSSLSFSSPVSAVSSLDGGEVILVDVTIDGSYDGGIYSRNGDLYIEKVSVSLNDGLYGLRSENTTISHLEELSIEGTLEGITLLGSDYDLVLRECTVRSNYTGLIYGGHGTMTTLSCKFVGSTYGAITRGPSVFGQNQFRDNLIGLMAEEGALRKAYGNQFTGFGKWGIEEESWEVRVWPDNNFGPGDTALGNYAWWGRVNVSVVSEVGFEVEGVELELRTMAEPPVRISSGEVGMVWGYSSDGDTVAAPNVNISAKWGTSTASTTFRPLEMEVHSITLRLVLSDLKVSDMHMQGNTLLVKVAVMGPGVRDARMTIYVDGSYRTSELFDLGPNGTTTLSFLLSGLDEGERRLTASVLSRDEYSGSDGVLSSNNEMSIVVRVENGRDSDRTYVILALCIMFVSMIVILIAGYLKKR